MSVKGNYMYNGEDNLIQNIMEMAAKNPPISREEERNLFIEYNSRDISKSRKEAIKVKIINSNMRFIIDYALMYRNFNISLADVISEAKFGLIEAIDTFDVTRNKKFISIAVWHIKSHVSKLLESSDLIKLPSHRKVLLNKTKKEMDVSEFDSDMKELYDLTQPYISYDSFVSDDGDIKFSDVLEDKNLLNSEESYIMNKSLVDILHKAKDHLTEEEFYVLTSLFGLKTGESMGLREVGDTINKSHERIRQIRDGALIKLREIEGIKDLIYSYISNVKE